MALRCRRISSRLRAARCVCWPSPSDSCSWSPVSTWPTSCSRARRDAYMSSRPARHWAPGLLGCSGSFSLKACSSPASGACLGLTLARIGVNVLQRLGGDAVPRLDEVGFNPVVLGFAGVTTMITAVTFGVLPALRFARVPPSRRFGSSRAPRPAARAGTAAQRPRRCATGACAHAACRRRRAVGEFLLPEPGAARIPRRRSPDLRREPPGGPVRRRAPCHLPGGAGPQARTIPGVVAAGGISFLPATGSYHGWTTAIDSGPRAGTAWPPSAAPATHRQRRCLRRTRHSAACGPHVRRAGRCRRSAARRGERGFASVAFPGLPLTASRASASRPAADARVVGVVGDVALDVYGAPALVVYHAHRQFAANRNWALSQVVATELPPERVLSRTDGDCGHGSGTGRPSGSPMSEVVGRGLVVSNSRSS